MVQVGDVWTDIDRLNQTAKERLGYPTQKPLALLDRIIQTSSESDDIVLDAFCGCGTALVAAQKLGRRWIGMDSSPTACRVMSERLRRDCNLREGIDFEVLGSPRSLDELRRMPPFEFQNWAVVALGGIPNKRRTGDKGIDGRFYPIASESKKDVGESGQFEFMKWYPVQVKQRDKAGRPDIDAFETAIQREDKDKGIFVSFDYTTDAEAEIRRFFKQTGRKIIAVTVRELMEMDETELAMKLA
jgi:SAM-dependent methyltransferase